MSPSWATFLFEAANFLLLAALLGFAFFRPMRSALERRRAALEAEQREAAAKRDEAERALNEAAARRSEIESSLSALRQRVRQEAADEGARLLAAAREQAQRERETLKEELVALRRGQASQRSEDAASAAREIVVRLLEHIGGPDLERALLETARSRLAGLADAGAVAPVIVESPRPLAGEALATLAEAAGITQSALAQRTVPGLVAGLRIVTARGLVDASAAGFAAQAERALLAHLEDGASKDG